MIRDLLNSTSGSGSGFGPHPRAVAGSSWSGSWCQWNHSLPTSHQQETSSIPKRYASSSTTSASQSSSWFKTIIHRVRRVTKFLCWSAPLLLWDAVRLCAFVLALSPGFVRCCWLHWYYFVTANNC